MSTYPPFLAACKGEATDHVPVCGGCRARAYAVTGDYMAEEPFCGYRPRGAEDAAAPNRAKA